MSGVRRVLLGLLIGFGIVGMIGITWIALQGTHVGVQRPDRRVDELVAELGIEDGLSIMVTRNRFTILDRHWPADLPNTTPYPLGSLGELFTAACVLYLHDQGEIDLDTPISDYLPGLAPALAAITPYQLLTHTGGLRDDRSGEVISEPGSVSFYARDGYDLLERLVETVSGTDLDTYLAENLLPRLDKAGEYERGAELAVTDLERKEGPGGDAIWYASPRDLLRWELAMNTGLLTRMKTHLRATRPAGLTDGGYGAFGAGWEISNYRGLRLEEIYAREPGYGANITRFAEKNFAVVILTDKPLSEVDTRVMARRIADFYLGRELPYGP